MPMPSQHDRQQAGGDLFAGGDDGVVFARVVHRRAFAAPGHQLIGHPRHRRDHHGDLVAGVDLALDMARDVADAVDVGDRGSAEFHHETRHGRQVPRYDRRGRWRLSRASEPKAAYTYRRGLPGATARDFGRKSIPTRAAPGRARARPGWGRWRPSAWRGSMISSSSAPPSTVDDAEVARFSALAAEWWNPRGKMAVLHKFNPVRLGFIKEAVCQHFGRDAKRLDCARRPAHSRYRLRRRHPVRAAGPPGRRASSAPIHPQANIAAARLHAAEAGLSIDYRATTAEALADAGERFDVVLAMEVVEHVADVPLFVASLRRDGEARRADGRGDAQPHAQELSRSPSSAPNTYWAGCRAAPISGTSSSPRTNWRSRWRRAGCRS